MSVRDPRDQQARLGDRHVRPAPQRRRRDRRRDRHRPRRHGAPPRRAGPARERGALPHDGRRGSRHDLDGRRRRQSTYFSKPWLDFTGRTLEQEAGKGSRDGIHPEDLPRFVAVYDGALAAPRPVPDGVPAPPPRRRVPLGPRDRDPAALAPSGEFEGFIGSVIDITDRRRAEDAVRESEERFRFMADAAPVMIWLDDENAGCTYFSKPWLDFTGRPLEEELGLGWLDGVHADDLARIRSDRGAARPEPGPSIMEYRLRRHDGEYRWIFDTAHPRFTPAGVFAGYIGSSIDITDRGGPRRPSGSTSSCARHRHAPEPRLRQGLGAGSRRWPTTMPRRLYGTPARSLLGKTAPRSPPPRQPDGRSLRRPEAMRQTVGRDLNGESAGHRVRSHRDAGGATIPMRGAARARLPSAARRLVRGSVDRHLAPASAPSGCSRRSTASPRRRARPRTSTSSTPRSTASSAS